MATKKIQTTETIETEEKYPQEIADLKKNLGANWEHFESVIEDFLGKDFSIQLPCYFMDMENSARTIPLDYVYQRANQHGLTLSAYLKQYCETVGAHTVDLRLKHRYFVRLPYRLDVVTACRKPHQSSAFNQQNSQNFQQGASPSVDLAGMAALLTALKPEPAADSTPILLEMIRSTEARAREDMKSMLQAFKNEMQSIKESAITPADIIDNMREMKDLQKEFTSAPASVASRFQTVDKAEVQPQSWIDLAKYAVDKVAPGMSQLARPAQQPVPQPAAATSENLTPEDLVDIKREDIVRALSSDLWEVGELIDETAELVMVAKKFNNLHLIPELAANNYDIYAAVDQLLEHCGSDEYKQKISEQLRAHPSYALLKVIKLDGSTEADNVDSLETNSKIRFA